MRKMYHVSIVDTDSVQNVQSVENTGTDDDVHSAIDVQCVLLYNDFIVETSYTMYNVHTCIFTPVRDVQTVLHHWVFVIDVEVVHSYQSATSKHTYLTFFLGGPMGGICWLASALKASAMR